MKDIIKKLKIENKSIQAICPDCGKYIIMRIDGDIKISELDSNISLGRILFDSLDELDFNIHLKVRCKSCRDEHDCEDECFTEVFALKRLLGAFNNFSNCGISTNKFCELSKTPKMINSTMAMEFGMPVVTYMIPINIKDDLESILSTLMISPQMCENGSHVVLNYEAETNGTAYYHAKFYLDKDIVNLIYDTKVHGRDYKDFVDKMFIRKIDALAELLERFSPLI